MKSFILVIILLMSVSIGCFRKNCLQSEKKLIITVNDLISHGYRYNGSTEEQETCITKFIPGVLFEYNYHFLTSVKYPGKPLNMYSTTFIYATDAPMKLAYLGSRYGLHSIEDEKEGVKIRPRKDFSYGDESQLYDIFIKNKRLGNVLLVRKDNILLLVIVYGIYFPDKDLITEIVYNSITRLSVHYGIGKYAD